MKLEAASIRFVLLFSVFVAGGQAQAEVPFNAPPGFRAEKVHRAFKGTGTEFDWLKVSDDHLALYLFDLDQNSGFSKKVKKKYRQNLVKYGAKAMEWSHTLGTFNEWLLASGVDFLDHSLKQEPVQMVIDPMVDRVETNLSFEFMALEPEVRTQWWVKAWIEPVDDQDFQFGYVPVVIHELGHFIFHSSLNKAGRLRLKDEQFVRLTLAPVDEAFADVVSYEFTHEPLVGKRYDYDLKKVVEFRRSLSSTSLAREKVRKGNWPYKQMGVNDHETGAPFRDVLIEIGEDYGNRAIFEVIRAIQLRLTDPSSPLMDPHVMLFSELNQAFNTAIAEELSRYPRLGK